MPLPTGGRGAERSPNHWLQRQTPEAYTHDASP